MFFKKNKKISPSTFITPSEVGCEREEYEASEKAKALRSYNKYFNSKRVKKLTNWCEDQLLAGNSYINELFPLFPEWNDNDPMPDYGDWMYYLSDSEKRKPWKQILDAGWHLKFYQEPTLHGIRYRIMLDTKEPGVFELTKESDW